MTGQDILIRVNDEMGTALTWEEMLPRINDCLDDLSVPLKFQCQALAETVPGYSEYLLPEDYLDMRTVWVGDERYHPIPEPDEDMPDNRSPEGYVLWPGMFKIQPTPQSVLDITLNYNAYLPHMELPTEEPGGDVQGRARLPRHYHRAVIWFCCHQLSFKHGTPERMQQAHALYDRLYQKLEEESGKMGRKSRVRRVLLTRRDF